MWEQSECPASAGTLQLIMDGLRYWVLDMHVDGFRFDLASHIGPENSMKWIV